MQQSDHQRRLDQAKKPTVTDRQAASVAAIEDQSGNLDYVVFIILVASVVALVVISRRRGKARKTFRM
jgi:hypothetical protein